MGQEEKILNTPDIAAPDKKSGAAPTSTTIKDDTKVKVRSLVPAVYYTCLKTMDSFAWEEVGDEQEMTYMQIKTMKAKHPRYFTEKWLLICSDAVLKKLNLASVFAAKITAADMKKFYGSDVVAVKELLSSLSDSAKAGLVKKITDAVKSGKIDNVKIIRLLEKQLGIELMQFV